MRHSANKTPAPIVELDAGEYLIDILMEAGPTKSGPMGDSMALDRGSLRDYDYFSVVKLDEIEARLLIQMSRAFVSGMNEGESPFSIAPADRESSKSIL